jgi:predicted NACHT family NTPase
MPAAMGTRPVHRARSTPESRRLERAKILQHLFVLEQQAERRWRLAMDFMVAKMLVFEEEHMYVFTLERQHG